jgi:hypothetical protein
VKEIEEFVEELWFELCDDEVAEVDEGEGGGLLELLE